MQQRRLSYPILFQAFCHFLIAIFCAFISYGESEQPSLTFYSEPDDTYTLLNGRVTLHCRIIPLTTPQQVTWFYNEQPLNLSLDVNMYMDRFNSLVIVYFDRKYEGKYRCRVTIPNGQSKESKLVTVALAFLEKYAEGPQSKAVSVGHTVILECNPPLGLPRPRVQWYRGDNTKSVDVDSRIHVLSNGDLRIDFVQMSDADSYQCTAHNIAGTWTSPQCHLRIIEKPHFTLTPSNVMVRSGETIYLPCDIWDPLNVTMVMWFKESNSPPLIDLLTDNRSSIYHQYGLLIRDARMSDSGRYVCSVFSDVGIIEAAANVTVFSVPEFIATPSELLVPLRASFRLSCAAVGFPKPYVFWKRVDDASYFFPIEDSRRVANGKRISVSESGELNIRGARESDSGVYECHATSWLGEQVSSGHVSVHHENEIPPMIEILPWNVTVQINTQAVILPCQPKNVQQSTVAWLKNGFNIVSGRRHILLANGSLLIQHLVKEDTANYTCKVSDKIRERYAEWTISLCVVDKVLKQSPVINLSTLPSSPKNVKVLSTGDTRVTLAWDEALSTHHNTTYMVEYFLQEDNDVNEASRELSVTKWQSVAVEYMTTRVDVKGLLPNRGYWFVVRSMVNITPSSCRFSFPVLAPRVVYTALSSFMTNSSPLMSATKEEVVSRLALVHTSALSLLSLSSTEMLITFQISFETGSDSAPSFHGFLVSSTVTNMSYCNPDFGIKTEHINDPCLQRGLSNLWVASKWHEEQLAAVPKKTQIHEFHLSMEDLSLANHHQLIVKKLDPVTCYEIHVIPYFEMKSGQRILAPSSRSKYTLTHMSSSVEAPTIIESMWIDNGTQIEIKWIEMSSWKAQCFIHSYILYIIANDIKFSWLRVTSEQTRVKLSQMDPLAHYTFHVSSVSCYGEGVRSFPFRLEPFFTSSNSAYSMMKLMRSWWFIFIMVLLPLVLVTTGLILCFVFRVLLPARKRKRHEKSFLSSFSSRTTETSEKQVPNGAAQLIFSQQLHQSRSERSFHTELDSRLPQFYIDDMKQPFLTSILGSLGPSPSMSGMPTPLFPPVGYIQDSGSQQQPVDEQQFLYSTYYGTSPSDIRLPQTDVDRIDHEETSDYDICGSEPSVYSSSRPTTTDAQALSVVSPSFSRDDLALFQTTSTENSSTYRAPQSTSLHQNIQTPSVNNSGHALATGVPGLTMSTISSQGNQFISMLPPRSQHRSLMEFIPPPPDYPPPPLLPKREQFSRMCATQKLAPKNISHKKPSNC